MDNVAVPASPEVGRNTMTQEMGMAMDKAQCDMLYYHGEMVEHGQEKMMGATEDHIKFDADQLVKVPRGNIGQN